MDSNRETTEKKLPQWYILYPNTKYPESKMQQNFFWIFTTTLTNGAFNLFDMSFS